MAPRERMVAIRGRAFLGALKLGSANYTCARNRTGGTTIGDYIDPDSDVSMNDKDDEKIRIAVSVITPGPYVRAWSGTPYYLTAALEACPEVEVHVTSPPLRWLYRATRIVSGLTGRVLGRRINWEVEPRVLRLFTTAMRRQWRTHGIDAVLAMGWMPAGLKDTDPVVLFWGDASLGQRIDRAPHWSGISRRTRRLADLTEGQMIAEVDGVIMPSEWAADDFKARYDLPSAKVHRIPFGANIIDPGEVLRRAPSDAIRLLSVGVEWERKGLDKVVVAADELQRMGYRVHLDVVGALPPSAEWHRPYAVFHGFLSKGNPQDAATLDGLYRKADFFILASRSDPSPMVLGESGAYSLPVIASAVDGIPERVDRGGVLISPDDEGVGYAREIQKVLLSGTYSSLCVGARHDFESLSDWNAHVPAILRACREAISARTVRHQ